MLVTRRKEHVYIGMDLEKSGLAMAKNEAGPGCVSGLGLALAG
jgi:hypothetical protein